MKSTAITLEGLNKALKRVPREAAANLRDAAQRIAGKVAQDASTKARGLGPQAALVAGSIKATRDRVPVVKAGGSKRLPTHSDGRKRVGSRQTVGDVFFGTNFGSHKYTQFPPVTKPDRFLWKSIKDDGEYIRDEYLNALDEAIDTSVREQQ